MRTNPPIFHWAARQPRFLPSILGDLELVTAPSGSVVSVADVKTQAIIEYDDDDAYIENNLIASAVRLCEDKSDRQFLTATYDLPLMGFWPDYLVIPKPPLQSITWIKYYDSVGVQQTLDSSYYEVRKPLKMAAKIERVPGKYWPSVQTGRRFPVSLRFVCGYGTSTNVPATIKQAILMLCSYWYENREAAYEGSGTKQLEFAVNALLNAEGYGAYS